MKKKHSSHAITADVDIARAAQAAAFFGADAVVVTAVEVPVAIGSGITPDNLPGLWDLADVFIVGSFIKLDGQWHRPPDPDRVDALLRVADRLR